MEICSGAAQVLASGGMQLSGSVSPLSYRALSIPQLPFSAPFRSSLCSTDSVQRTFPRHVPRLRKQQGPRVSCTMTEGNRELKQEQQRPSSELSRLVEHVVFFKMKDDPEIEELFEELRALKSLDGIISLSVSKVLQVLGANYTHVLHSRHLSKASLDAYAVHPSHKAVVRKLLRYIEDSLAVDWEAVPVGLPIEGGHGATRICLIKVADGLTEEELEQVFALLSGLRKKFPFIRQISAGSNFSPARAKGFSVGFLAMFNNLEELEELNGNSELHSVLRRSKVAPFLTGFLIADVDSL